MDLSELLAAINASHEEDEACKYIYLIGRLVGSTVGYFYESKYKRQAKISHDTTNQTVQ